MNQPDTRVKAYITAILKKDKTLKEREVKAAVRKGLKLGRAPIGAGVIREVRKSLGIDRPRAITYARNLLAKYPTLEAKKVIEDVGEKFGISLAAPDVSHLRPAGARRKRAARTRVGVQRTRKIRQYSGTISVRYDAKGFPQDIANFFLSLAE